MAARPLRVVGSSALAAVDAALRAALATWQRDWGVSVASPECSVERAWEAAKPPCREWRVRWDGARGHAWCNWHADLAAEVQRLAFPADGGYAVAAEGTPRHAPAIAAEAVDSLATALREAITGVGSASILLRQPEQVEYAPLSGAVSVQLRIGRQAVQLLLDGACVAALAPAPAAPAPLGKIDMFAVMSQVPVSLTVVAGAAQLGAGALMTAGVGDVIRLDTSLADPFTLEAGPGKPVITAYIGRCGSHVAVEIAGKHKQAMKEQT